MLHPTRAIFSEPTLHHKDGTFKIYLAPQGQHKEIVYDAKDISSLQ